MRGRIGLVRMATCAFALSMMIAYAATASAAGTSPLGHAIVFSRFEPGVDTGQVYRIDAGSTVEQPIAPAVDAAILSRDGTEFCDVGFTSDGRLTATLFDVDGSNTRTLPLTDPTLQLPGAFLSPDHTRVISQGWDDNDPSRTGLYSRRSSDGGGLIRLTNSGNRVDYPVAQGGFSPDGSMLLFDRPHAKGGTSDSAAQDLFVVGTDGTGLTRLTPRGMTTGVVFSGATSGWSPDGSWVVVVLSNGPFWRSTVRSVYLVHPDGTGLHRIGPRGDIWDAAWSPDGEWIAFTMAAKSTGAHELYVMHPDGSGVAKLVSADDGRFSISPKWSPDAQQLLITRGADDVHVSDLWSVNVHGSDLYQITHDEVEYRAVAWIP